ncbi:SLBB domain-containing protein [candidate division KSB1 bacterium]|nr:SLBB domain-containing protein [candidate division KSB1 bacterium]
MSATGARTGLIVVALVCLTCTLLGQIPSGGSSMSPGGSPNDLQSLLSRSAGLPAKSGEVFFEGAVNPDEYVVGPGDQFMLYFWKPTYSEVSATVNAEGELAVPLVGMVRVADRTLNRAKAEIDEAVARSMRIAAVSSSLVTPRRFRVHVTGAVNFPGTYVVRATDRIADAIDAAGGFARTVSFSKDGIDSANIGSLRQIAVVNRDGSLSGTADLALFFRSGVTSANPLLRDGQSINVPEKTDGGPSITVTGSVRSGGSFEWKQSDDLGTAIKLAGGLSETADGRSIQVIGRSGGPKSLDIVTTPGLLTTKLAPGDHVLVVGAPDTSRIGSVLISGEVAHPGGYAVTSGETTLRDILASAGGLLPTAAAQSARLIRDPKQDPLLPERDRILAELFRSSQVISLENDPGLAAEFARWDYSTVVLDLSHAESLNNEAGDIVLHSGDRLEIPRTPLGVRVVGAVNEAGEVAWQADEDIRYYIDAAGGKNKGGWVHRAMIIKARNGSQIRYQSSLPIDPGDLIYVPPKPAYASAWNSFKDFIATAAQVATVVLVVQQTTK